MPERVAVRLVPLCSCLRFATNRVVGSDGVRRPVCDSEECAAAAVKLLPGPHQFEPIEPPEFGVNLSFRGGS